MMPGTVRRYELGRANGRPLGGGGRSGAPSSLGSSPDACRSRRGGSCCTLVGLTSQVLVRVLPRTRHTSADVDRS